VNPDKAATFHIHSKLNRPDQRFFYFNFFQLILLEVISNLFETLLEILKVGFFAQKAR